MANEIGHHTEGLRAVPTAPNGSHRVWGRQVGAEAVHDRAEQVAWEKERRTYRMEVTALGESEVSFIGWLMIESEQWVLLPHVMTVRCRLVASATGGISLSPFHNAFRFYHRARAVRVAEHAMRVGRLEQGFPELFRWRAGQRSIHGSAAAHRACGLHGHRDDSAAACSVEAAGSDARSLCLGLGWAFGQTHSALGLLQQLVAMDDEDAEGER